MPSSMPGDALSGLGSARQPLHAMLRSSFQRSGGYLSSSFVRRRRVFDDLTRDEGDSGGVNRVTQDTRHADEDPEAVDELLSAIPSRRDSLRAVTMMPLTSSVPETFE